MAVICYFIFLCATNRSQRSAAALTRRDSAEEALKQGEKQREMEQCDISSPPLCVASTQSRRLSTDVRLQVQWRRYSTHVCLTKLHMLPYGMVWYHDNDANLFGVQTMHALKHMH